MNERKRFYAGLAASIGVHLAVFLTLGALLLFGAPNPAAAVVDVTIYDAGAESAQASGKNGGAFQSPAAPPPPAPDDIAEKPQREKPPDETRAKPVEAQKKTQSAPPVASSLPGESSAGKAAAGEGGNGESAGSNGKGQESAGDRSGAENPADAPSPKVMPVYRSGPNPAYPAADITGTVTVRILVGADGNVESASIASSSGSAAIDNAALSATRRWKFTPAKNSVGAPVRCNVTKTFAFDLRTKTK